MDAQEKRFSSILDMLRQDPEDVFLNYALALELIKREQLDEAEKYLLKTVSLDKSYIAAYYQLGKLNEKIQQVATALSWYRKGLAETRAVKDLKAASEFEEAIFLLED
jgi:tetratricopeptide (TPR) repeat protein